LIFFFGVSNPFNGSRRPNAGLGDSRLRTTGFTTERVFVIGSLMIPIGAAAVFDAGHQTLLYKPAAPSFPRSWTGLGL